jgi:hypothetical protein
MKAVKMVAAAGLFALGASVQAQSLAARAGTTGLGAELGFGLGSGVGLRANLAGGSYSRSDVESNINYEGKLKLGNGALLLDLHPFAGSFRLSAGAVYNNNRLEATARGDSGTIEINGISYPASAVGTLQADVRWDKMSPYLGIGWGSQPRGSGGLFFSADLGAFYLKPTASLTGTCGPSVPTLACSQLQSDIRAEERQFQEDIDKFKLYPVLSVGLGYRF